MSRIKFLVTGINNEVLGSLIGTLAQGELPGEAEIIVVPQQTPKAYVIGNGGQTREIPFTEFLAATVAVERKKIIERSSGEQLIQEVIEKSSSHEPAVIPFKPHLLQ
jgi:hypothetical protein